MKRCCVNCFGDTAVREFIAELGEIGDCDYCGAQGVPTGDLGTVGDFVRMGLARAYGDATTVHVRDSRDEKFLARAYAYEVLEAEAEIVDASRGRHLALDILSAFRSEATKRDYYWLDEGDALIARPRGLYEFYGIEDANEYTSAWDSFKSRVMHGTRFFNIGESREELIGPVSNLFPKLEDNLKNGEKVYRARLAQNRLPTDVWELQQALGPPPARTARHSRMSPPGISYLYVSDDPDTCLAEIQPNVGREVWIARFEVLTEIKLLDLTKLPSIDIPSIFSNRYDPTIDWVDFFLRAFLDDVSQPLRGENDLLEYVPTQVLAEYIRVKGYQGIKYRSAQHPEGVNYTLFCSPDPDADPGLRHAPDRPIFHEWLRIEEVSTVRIASLKLQTSTLDTKPVPFDAVGLATQGSTG